MLKRFPFVIAMALFIIALSDAPSGTAQDAATKTKVTADSQAKAKKVYAIDCALCHGATGDGKTDLAKDMQLTLTDWTDPKSLAAPDQELFNVIRNGKDKMPPEEKGRASDDEIWNLIVYIRSFSKGQPAAPASSASSSPAPGK
jgi:mono/diheme cytochrome c family protein